MVRISSVQALLRYAQEECGLRNLMLEDADVSVAVKQLLVLPRLPPEMMEDVLVDVITANRKANSRKGWQSCSATSKVGSPNMGNELYPFLGGGTPPLLPWNLRHGSFYNFFCELISLDNLLFL